MPLRRVIVLVFVEVAEINRRYNSAFTHLLKGRKLRALSNDVIASLNVLLLVNSTIGSNEQDRELLNNLAQMLIRHHSSTIFFHSLFQFAILHLEHHDLLL